ncbi:MAG: tRNA (adenosine(37)-N6)-threonylcarbamoyltransferase complex dimerization subunit type 1 TsaB, partial [Pseudomonadota bacterium]
MNIVAIDTATEAFSVALKCGDDVRFRYSVEPRMHARLLLPALDELFAEAQLSRASLDAVTFGRGPGAFTGVRIATAASQAIAMAHDLPVAPVSTLAAIAGRAHRESGVTRAAVAIDARMAEVYWAAYALEATGPQLVGTERVCPPTVVEPLQGQWTPAGTGWEVYNAELSLASGVAGHAAVTLPHAL